MDYRWDKHLFCFIAITIMVYLFARVGRKKREKIPWPNFVPSQQKNSSVIEIKTWHE
jgi:hypothetical protein